MHRDSFIFFKSWWDAVGLLPGEVRGEVLTAIIEYGLFGETNSPRGNTTKAILELIKPQIEANNVKYANGKKGGRPVSDASGKDNLDNQTETEQKPNNNLTKTKRKPKQNQTETKAEPNNNLTITEPEPICNMLYDKCNMLNENVSSPRTRASEEVSEEERMKFLEIFFFRNIKDPAAEVDRFLAWNTGRHKRPTEADAAQWAPQDREKRCTDKFLSMWKTLYRVAQHSGPDGEKAAAYMLDDGVGGKCMNGRYVITCRREVKSWIEENQTSVEDAISGFLGGVPLEIKARR